MTLTNKPTASDLIQAVRQHLEEKVQPKLQGSDVFYLRIALNALSMVERELREGPALAEANRKELLALLGSGSADADAETLLMEKLKSGELDVNSSGLLDYLIARTQRRLSVDNPRYKYEKP
ncbi:MAG: DUF6285 domain-containing protein [Pedobacter sp.]|nr:DUF6285 domain-containing protein [Pedobacter sp.]